MFNDFNEILTEATPVLPAHNKLCLSPAMFYLSAIQYMGAMEFTFAHDEVETVALHVGECESRADMRTWVEEIENVARATFAACNAKDAQMYTFPRAQWYFEHVGNVYTSWVKWEFSVY